MFYERTMGWRGGIRSERRNGLGPFAIRLSLLFTIVARVVAGEGATHERYDDDEARTAMGMVLDENTLNHDKYTDDDARDAVGQIGITGYEIFRDSDTVILGFGQSETLQKNCPPHAEVLPWIQDEWNVNLGVPESGARRAFGEKATRDGERRGLADDIAVARLEATSDAKPFLEELTVVQITFSRAFELRKGFTYQLTLEASLKGELFGLDAGDIASIHALASIVEEPECTILVVGPSEDRRFSTRHTAGGTVKIDTGAVTRTTDGFTVQPGIYTVTACVTALTLTTCGDIGVDARSNFFNDDTFGYRVTGSFAAECTGDVNADGVVDLKDLLDVLAAWGNKGGPEDLDGSGFVDMGDILIVLAAWGPCR